MRSKRGVDAGAANGAASRSFQVAVPPPASGRAIERLMANSSWGYDVRPAAVSQRQLRQVDPAAFLPARERRLDQLHALGAFLERPLVRRVLDHVADERLPLDLEAVLVDLAVGNLLPLVVEVHRLLLVRVPD